MTVRKTVFDWVHFLYSAQIDVLGIAPASWPVEPAARPEPKRRGGGPVPANAAPASLTADDPTREPVVVRSEAFEVQVSPMAAGV